MFFYLSSKQNYTHLTVNYNLIHFFYIRTILLEHEILSCLKEANFLKKLESNYAALSRALIRIKADFHSSKNERAVGNLPMNGKSDKEIFRFPFTRIAARFRHHRFVLYTNVIYLFERTCFWPLFNASIRWNFLSLCMRLT